MTVALEPNTSSWANGYMLNFDYQAGGANANASYYVASGLTGIDFQIDSHRSTGGFPAPNHVHNFIGGANPQFDFQLLSAYGIVLNTEVLGGGVWAQEWEVPNSFFASRGDGKVPMTMWGSTISANTDDITYDTTLGLNLTPIPEPGVTGLAGLGALLLAVGRRRR